MTWAEIAKRAEVKSARPSMDFSADVYEALGYEVIRTPRWPGGVAWRYMADSRWQVMHDLSGSLDALIRVIGKTIPGGAWSVAYADGIGEGAVATLYLAAPNSRPIMGQSPIPSLALLAAYARARTPRSPDA